MKMKSEVLEYKWAGWPHVYETQQFSADTLDFLMNRVVGAESAMVRGLPPDRLSSPFSACRRLKIFREEPSTRTVETFYEAGRMLGYDIREIQSGFSSQMKGESLEDLVMAITQMGGMGQLRLTDVLVVRSKEEGAVKRAIQVIEDADVSECRATMLPVINAGDGPGQHPTQALVDLATIWRERNGEFDHPLDNIAVLLTGDILHSRTINSLCHLIGKFGSQHAITVLFCSHPDVGPKPGMLEYFNESGIAYEVVDDFRDAIKRSDVVYITRLQRERFSSQDIYRSVRGHLVFKAEYLDLLKKGAFVMHPLPINNDPADPPPEIDVALAHLARSNDSRCAWGRQSFRGVPVRYVLLDCIEAGLQMSDE